jgi:hypothetical protein
MFDARKLLRVVVILIGSTLALIGSVWLFAGCGADDGDLTVPAPDPADRQAVVAQLARATSAQGVCYGWRLDSSRQQVVSQGSNLGDNVSVDSNPVICTRWLQLVVTITYTPQDSEFEDSAGIDVESSTDLSDQRPTAVDLARLGLTEGRFLDDPADSTMRGVLALPLLLAEGGTVTAVPTPTPSTGAPAAPLPAASSDFWRNRLVWVLWTAGLLLIAALIGLYGWLTLRAERRKPVKKAPQPKAKA